MAYKGWKGDKPFFVCDKCGVEIPPPLNKFCLKCQKTTYKHSKSHKEDVRGYNKKYWSSHPERVSAWIKAKKIPVGKCVVCGKLPVHRHHPDITKPLEVVMLCPYHHVQVDRYGLQVPPNSIVTLN